MAPSQSQVVTLAAGSALVVGVIFTIFLVRRKNRYEEKSGEYIETGICYFSIYLGLFLLFIQKFSELCIHVLMDKGARHIDLSLNMVNI